MHKLIWTWRLRAGVEFIDLPVIGKIWKFMMIHSLRLSANGNGIHQLDQLVTSPFNKRCPHLHNWPANNRWMEVTDACRKPFNCSGKKQMDNHPTSHFPSHFRSSVSRLLPINQFQRGTFRLRIVQQLGTGSWNAPLPAGSPRLHIWNYANSLNKWLQLEFQWHYFMAVKWSGGQWCERCHFFPTCFRVTHNETEATIRQGWPLNKLQSSFHYSNLFTF